ncbi:MAG TPA: IspD/TarI family cytidylyltransferase [Candidatus Krumholzibacteria bacterium]|nr:IspD/TarI family cytidylyltransferase [Candidatus Krumholzibacteria bacterium]
MGAEKPRLHLILLAGGRGMRAEKDDLPPKQFRTTRRGMLFTCALQNFLNVRPQAVTVTVAVPDAWYGEASAALTPLLDPLGLPWLLAPAGTTRTASTGNAVEALANSDHAPKADGLIAVHDGARPFASDDLLDRLCVATLTSGSSVPGIEVADTIIQKEADGQATYLDRNRLLAVQTPQVFRWDIFLEAHRWAKQTGARFTDDGSLMAARGYPPVIVPGDPRNWKITTDADWRRVEELLG